MRNHSYLLYLPSSNNLSEWRNIFGIFETVVLSCKSWFKYSVAVNSSGIILVVVVVGAAVPWLDFGDELAVEVLYNLAFFEYDSRPSCVLSRGKVFWEWKELLASLIVISRRAMHKTGVTTRKLNQNNLC
jgi:hypothetical protein